MALFNGHGKTRNRSDSSSGEEDPLINNRNKITSYGAQEYSPSGVRIQNLLYLSFSVMRNVVLG
jgi:hypothetical protein